MHTTWKRSQGRITTRALFGLLALAGLSLSLIALSARPATRTAEAQTTEEDLIAQGEYLANIARCISCHTPNRAEFNAETLTEEQTRTLALSPRDALDMDLFMAGGRVFNFGPAGSVTASNITPDEETGIGAWTDEELRTALQTGVSRNGRRMHGIMPAMNNVAASDVDAIIAYMRSLPAIQNEVVNELEVTAPPASLPETPITAPDNSDPTARGAYLANLMSCSGCHTPTDPETRRPILEKFLAGRDPFQQPYGTVYAGNITPHDETGIGTWTEAQIARALVEGVRIDGRRLALMPWQDYASLTDADRDAIVHYLVNDIEAVENSIPATDLQEPYRVFAEVEETTASEEEDSNTMLPLVIGAAAVLLVAGGAFVYMSRSRAA